jgi:hypothetical protein
MPKTAGETTREAVAKSMPKAVAKSMVEMIEPLHDDDRWGETEEPGLASPIRKGLGKGVVGGIRVAIGIG